MNRLFTKITTLTLLTAFTGLANASFTVHIPTEASSGGFLANGSIIFQDKSGGENGNGSTPPTEPSVPTEPTTPEEPTEPEEIPRSLVFSGDFQTFSGETNLWTTGKKDAFYLTNNTIVLKGALKHDATYYIGNNGNECPYIADVCTTDASNRCGPFTSKNLSGENTILSKKSLAESNCININVNHFTNAKSVTGLKIFDGPQKD